MNIKTTLSQKDYANANMNMLLQSTGKYVIAVACFIFLVASVGSIVNHKYVSSTEFFVPAIMIVYFFGFSYLKAKKNYTSNARIQETITYEMEKDFLFIKGESFQTQLTWEKIYKVSKTKNWVLIWQTKQTANLIPRRDINDNDIASLKGILAMHGVKNNL